MSKILKSISATSITTYEECPLKWKYQYIYKLLQLPNDAFIIGIAYHKALQFYHQLPTENTKEKIIKQLKNEMLIKKTDDEIKRFSLVRKMFEKYIENPVLGNIIEKEFNFNVTLPSLPVKLYGFVDRVDEDFIIEYKTTSEDYTQERIDNLQSKIYTYAVLKTKGKLPSLSPIVNSEELIEFKKSKRYLEFIAIENGEVNPVLRLISVFASILSSLKLSKVIILFKNVIFKSVEIVVICFIESIIKAFGKMSEFAISLGIIREYSGNFPFINFVKNVYCSE